MSTLKTRQSRPRFPPPRRRTASLNEVLSFSFSIPEEEPVEETPSCPPTPEWPLAVEGSSSFGCFPFPGSAPDRRYSVALPAQQPGNFLTAPVQVPTGRDRSPRRKSYPVPDQKEPSKEGWEREGIEEAVKAWRRRRRVTGLVDQLLIEIYGLWGGREGRERHPSRDDSSTDYMTEWSTTTGSSSLHSGVAFQKGVALDSLRKSRLKGKDIDELGEMVATLEENVNYAGSLLVRQLKKRDTLISKRDRHCDLITAILQAVSEKRSQDTRMRFSVVPPPPGDSGFEQWRDAMRMVARLPGGIPPEFRRRLWLTLAEKHLQSRGVDWTKAERMCLNEWRHPDDEELGIQIVKDLHRTGCSLFCGGTEGAAANQAVLKRVLLGFARWNKAVGYCQGFNMLAALILQVTERSEADAIKVMIYLIEGVLPEGYFADHLRGLSVDMAVFRDLLRIRLPALSRHLETLQHDARDTATGAVYEPPLTNVFTMQWFLTLFCNCLPRAAVLRVWDLVFLEGSEVLLRTALAIWDGLQDRIMAVGSADEFYSIMGVLTREMLEFGLMDSNNLIKAIVSMGPFPFPGLADLRDRHLYNITPWSRSVSAVARRGLGRIFYAGEEEEEEEEDEEEKNDVKSAPLPTAVDRERLSLDVWALRQQYSKLRERQRQAHVILTAACARQMGPSPSAPSHGTAVNHLLLGKSALLPPRGRRRGPPPGSVPAPLRRIHPPPPATKEAAPAAPPAPSPPEESGETLLWKDAKKLQGKGRKDSDSGSATSPLNEPEDVKQTSPEVHEDKENDENNETKLNWDRDDGRERRRTYSSSSGSSSSTELCDDDAAHLSDLDSSGEGPSPVPAGGSNENNDQVFSPIESPHDEREPLPSEDTSESKKVWESIGTEDSSKEGRLSSSTMTPGVEEAPFSPQEVTEFKLPELYLPPLSSSVSTHLTPPVSPLENTDDQEKPPKPSLNNLLLASPQQLTPASSTTTSSASEPSPSTSSSPGPMASTTSSPPSSPPVFSSKAAPSFATPEFSDAIEGTYTQSPLDKPDTVKPPPEDTSPESKMDDWMDAVGAKPEVNIKTPPGVDSLLMQWSHLDTEKWKSSADTPVSEADEKPAVSPTLPQPRTPITPDTSLSHTLIQSVSTSTYSTLLPSTSVNIPMDPSPSPQTLDMEEAFKYTASPSPLLLLESSSTILPVLTPMSDGPGLNLDLQSSPLMYTPSSTPSPLLPPSTTTPALFTMPPIPPLFHMTSTTLPPLPPSTTPPPFIPLLGTQSSVFTSSSITEPYSSLSLMTTDSITTMPLSSPSFPTAVTASTSFPSYSPSTPPPYHPTTVSSVPQTLSPLSPQPFYHITATTVPSHVSSPSPISFHLTTSTAIPSTTSPSIPISFLPTTKSVVLPTASPSSPVSFHPTTTATVPSTSSPACTLTFYPTSSTTQPYVSSSSPPFHSPLSLVTPLTTSSTNSPPLYSSLSSPPPLTVSSTSPPLYQSSGSTLTSLVMSPSLPSHPASSQDAASALELTSRQSSSLSITTKSVPSTSMLPKMSTTTQPQRTFHLPPLPLHPILPLSCDTDSTSEEKQKNPTSLPINWDWLPRESNILKKPKSGSSPSSLLASPIGATSKTIIEGNPPSSPTKSSQNHATRRHSERALRIIQENSEILQRMLRQPPPPSPPSPVAAFPSLQAERLHVLDGGEGHQTVEGGDRSPHSPASPASSSWALDTSTDLSASASSKSPATSPVPLGDVISWGVRRGTFAMPPGGTLPSPPVTSPQQTFNPFPQRSSWRQPKELGVKLGLYSSASSPSPPVTQTRSSPSTPTSPSKSSSAYFKQMYK
ncbi:mucin-5AC-like [Ischnura elegans]|uniref:mucin-5AC-like n=1 Tax=Ischnura elegans TaxID=197161 RepID=UPI001ED87607|nr:mucin-5AC-like [Ischnura elegans]